jgi:hypothetical protein
MNSVPQALPNSPAGTARPSIRSNPINRLDRKLDAPGPLRLWHLASLDAPTVAVVWALAFAWAARVRLPDWIVAAIALVVWTVYVADRLLDARRAMSTGHLELMRDRHFYHWRHRGVLVSFGCVAAAVAAGVIFKLIPWASARRDSLLAAAAALYFARVHSGAAVRRGFARCIPRWVSKELLVGVLFTAGCVLPVWNRAGTRPWALLAPATAFAVVAWLNCAAIDNWERGEDVLSRALLRAPTLWFFALLFGVVSAGAAALLAAAAPRCAGLLLAASISSLSIAALDGVRGRLTPILLRAMADLVLLTPLMVMIR